MKGFKFVDLVNSQLQHQGTSANCTFWCSLNVGIIEQQVPRKVFS